MIFLYLALICFGLGLLVWIAGSIVDKQRKRQHKAMRKKYMRMADTLNLAAKIILILSALFFVLGFVMVQGMQAKL